MSRLKNGPGAKAVALAAVLLLLVVGQSLATDDKKDNTVKGRIELLETQVADLIAGGGIGKPGFDSGWLTASESMERVAVTHGLDLPAENLLVKIIWDNSGGDFVRGTVAGWFYMDSNTIDVLVNTGADWDYRVQVWAHETDD